VVSGPEPFAAAKDRLRGYMHSGYPEGVMELWTEEGVSDRFKFKGSSPGLDAAPAEAATDGGSTPPDSTPVEDEPAAPPANNFARVGKRRR
jgi:hypothetical protein